MRLGEMDKRTWSESDLAYAAGFLDGEGCFTVLTNWQIAVTCTNTYQHAIAWLQEMFGGSVSGPHVSKKPGWRPTFQWKVKSRVAEQAIKALRPYLREKAAQADLLLELQSTMGPGGGRLSTEVLSRREAISEKVRSLKREVI